MLGDAQAIGRYLLSEVAGGAFAGEEFLICRQLAGGTDFALLTSHRLLRVSWPGLRFLPAVTWFTLLADILHIRR